MTIDISNRPFATDVVGCLLIETPRRINESLNPRIYGYCPKSFFKNKIGFKWKKKISIISRILKATQLMGTPNFKFIFS